MQPFLALILPITTGGQPPVEGEEPRPDHDLPLFPFYPIVVPPGGAWPGEPPPEPTEPPTGEGEPSHPINLPPSDQGYWVFVFIPGVGWQWVAISPQPLPPNETHPQPK